MGNSGSNSSNRVSGAGLAGDGSYPSTGIRRRSTSGGGGSSSSSSSGGGSGRTLMVMPLSATIAAAAAAASSASTLRPLQAAPTTAAAVTLDAPVAACIAADDTGRGAVFSLDTTATIGRRAEAGDSTTSSSGSDGSGSGDSSGGAAGSAPGSKSGGSSGCDGGKDGVLLAVTATGGSITDNNYFAITRGSSGGSSIEASLPHAPASAVNSVSAFAHTSCPGGPRHHATDRSSSLEPSHVPGYEANGDRIAVSSTSVRGGYNGTGNASLGGEDAAAAALSGFTGVVSERLPSLTADTPGFASAVANLLAARREPPLAATTEREEECVGRGEPSSTSLHPHAPHQSNDTDLPSFDSATWVTPGHDAPSTNGSLDGRRDSKGDGSAVVRVRLSRFVGAGSNRRLSPSPTTTADAAAVHRRRTSSGNAATSAAFDTDGGAAAGLLSAPSLFSDDESSAGNAGGGGSSGGSTSVSIASPSRPTVNSSELQSPAATGVAGVTASHSIGLNERVLASRPQRTVTSTSAPSTMPVGVTAAAALALESGLDAVAVEDNGYDENEEEDDEEEDESPDSDSDVAIARAAAAVAAATSSPSSVSEPSHAPSSSSSSNPLNSGGEALSLQERRRPLTERVEIGAVSASPSQSSSYPSSAPAPSYSIVSDTATTSDAAGSSQTTTGYGEGGGDGGESAYTVGGLGGLSGSGSFVDVLEASSSAPLPPSIIATSTVNELRSGGSTVGTFDSGSMCSLTQSLPVEAYAALQTQQERGGEKYDGVMAQYGLSLEGGSPAAASAEQRGSDSVPAPARVATLPVVGRLGPSSTSSAPSSTTIVTASVVMPTGSNAGGDAGTAAADNDAGVDDDDDEDEDEEEGGKKSGRSTGPPSARGVAAVLSLLYGAASVISSPLTNFVPSVADVPDVVTTRSPAATTPVAFNRGSRSNSAAAPPPQPSLHGVSGNASLTPALAAAAAGSGGGGSIAGPGVAAAPAAKHSFFSFGGGGGSAAAAAPSPVAGSATSAAGTASAAPAPLLPPRKTSQPPRPQPQQQQQQQQLQLTSSSEATISGEAARGGGSAPLAQPHTGVVPVPPPPVITLIATFLDRSRPGVTRFTLGGQRFIPSANGPAGGSGSVTPSSSSSSVIHRHSATGGAGGGESHPVFFRESRHATPTPLLVPTPVPSREASKDMLPVAISIVPSVGIAVTAPAVGSASSTPPSTSSGGRDSARSADAALDRASPNPTSLLASPPSSAAVGYNAPASIPTVVSGGVGSALTGFSPRPISSDFTVAAGGSGGEAAVSSSGGSGGSSSGSGSLVAVAINSGAVPVPTPTPTSRGTATTTPTSTTVGVTTASSTPPSGRTPLSLPPHILREPSYSSGASGASNGGGGVAPLNNTTGGPAGAAGGGGGRTTTTTPSSSSAASYAYALIEPRPWVTLPMLAAVAAAVPSIAGRFSGLVLDTLRETCPSCGITLTDAQIRAGWNPSSQDYTTVCPVCPPQAPFFSPAPTPTGSSSSSSFSGGALGPAGAGSDRGVGSGILHTTSGSGLVPASATSGGSGARPPLRKQRFVARFAVTSTSPAWTGTGGAPGGPLFCEYLPPAVLLKELQSAVLHGQMHGGLAAGSPTLYWNLVLWFLSYGLPCDFLAFFASGAAGGDDGDEEE